MKPYLLPITIAFAAVSHVSAANLLLTNPSFDLVAQFNQYLPGTSTTTTAVSGWLGVLGAASNGTNFVGTADDQNGLGNPRFGYTGNNAFWETAAANRAIVSAGDYTFAYSGRNGVITPTNPFVFVDWFNSGGTLISSSSNFASDFAATTGVPSTQANPNPFGNYSHTVTAPVGSVRAGVRWGTTGATTDATIIGDNFSLAVIPEPSSALLSGLGLGLALLRRKRN